MGTATNPTINFLDHMMYEWMMRRADETAQRKPKYLFDVGAIANAAETKKATAAGHARQKTFVKKPYTHYEHHHHGGNLKLRYAKGLRKSRRGPPPNWQQVIEKYE